MWRLGSLRLADALNAGGVKRPAPAEGGGDTDGDVPGSEGRQTRSRAKHSHAGGGGTPSEPGGAGPSRLRRSARGRKSEATAEVRECGAEGV